MQVNYFADWSLEFLEDPAAVALLEVIMTIYLFTYSLYS